MTCLKFFEAAAVTRCVSELLTGDEGEDMVWIEEKAQDTIIETETAIDEP